jgi:plastocyanin
VELSRPLAVLAFALSCAVMPVSPAAAACSGDVTVSSYAFTPATKNVPAGATVTWCWADGGHSVTGTWGDSGVLAAGATFSHAFTQSASYHCSVHSSMNGTIVVAGATPSHTTKPTTPAPTHTTAPATPPPTTRAATTSPPATSPSATAPSATAPPTTRAATTAPTTSAPATVAATTAAATPTGVAQIDPAPAKPKTGLAVALGLLVAACAIGGAAWLLLRGRS